jgi:hypothetical protein
MENENQLDSFFKIALDEKNREDLKTISMWAKIAAICAFISYGVALIVAFFGKLTTNTFGAQTETVSSFARAGAIGGSLIAALIGTAINYFLYRFATDTKLGLANLDQIKLNEGLRNLKTYFKILGIILLICLIFGGLIFIVAMFAAMGRG